MPNSKALFLVDLQRAEGGGRFVAGEIADIVRVLQATGTAEDLQYFRVERLASIKDADTATIRG
jgi:hypothetical protein